MDFINGILKREELVWNKVSKNIPIVFFGCGNNAHIMKRILESKGLTPMVYCDNNPQVVGTTIDGIEVLSYEQVRERYQQYYMILTVAVNNAIPILGQLNQAKEKNPIFHMEKPFKVDDELLEYDYLESHLQEFEKVYELLEDEQSKTIFLENINFRLSGDKIKLAKYIDGNTFFDEKLIPMSEHYSYVDVGAYTGDMLLCFYAFCGGKYDAIYAVEPDKGNFSSLERLVKYGKLEDVFLFQVGGWDCKDELVFYTIDDSNARNFDSPNFFKNMNKTVPSSWKIGKEHFVEQKIAVDTVDHLLQGRECTLLKINALAADFQVLKGSAETIKRCRPVIVGEFGVRKENLTKMLLFIKEISPSYHIYLRQKMIFGDYKTVFTAVCDS